IGVNVLMGLIGAQTFFNRAGAQKQEEKKVETTISNASPVATSAAATTKPSAEELKKKLTPQQYHVTQECGTEPPFNNAYWNNHAPGIYVDIVTGEPLFTSLDKFDSGSGWPSFAKPIAKEKVVEKSDRTMPTERLLTSKQPKLEKTACKLNLLAIAVFQFPQPNCCKQQLLGLADGRSLPGG